MVNGLGSFDLEVEPDFVVRLFRLPPINKSRPIIDPLLTQLRARAALTAA